jgi:hypothetical protein
MAHIAHAAHSRRRAARNRPTALLVGLLLTFAALAVGYIAYVLWPRWPAAVLSLDAPTLPITVGGVTFNIPPAAVRVAVQRRPGAQERVDLAFRWPSLAPPDPHAKPPSVPHEPDAVTAPVIDRVFVSIAASDGLSPTERIRTIYPRYSERAPTAGAGGLAVLAFRRDTPYSGEDLIYDAREPERFLVRCTRDGSAAVSGTCLYERRIEAADVVVRFPRAWLADWPAVAGGIEQLLAQLRPTAG